MSHEIVVGTYEELILGYYLNISDKSGQLEASFTDHSHGGSIRSASVSEQGVLATGSTDEKIQLFNLTKRSAIGMLDHHEGTVTDVKFWGKHHLFTCSEDGTMAVIKSGKWECLRTFRGHKGMVNCVSIHPSGKLALTVGRDKSLRTWNLINGRSAFVTNLKYEADSVYWTPDGDSYLVMANNKINKYSVNTAAVEQSFELPARIQCATFVEFNILAVSGDGGDIHLFNISSGKLLHRFPTKTNRVKGLSVQRYSTSRTAYWLITASSDGFLKVWNLEQSSDVWTIELMCEIDTKFRLTCLAVLWSSKDSTINESATNALNELELGTSSNVDEEEYNSSSSNADDQDGPSKSSLKHSVENTASERSSRALSADGKQSKDSTSNKSAKNKQAVKKAKKEPSRDITISQRETNQEQHHSGIHIKREKKAKKKSSVFKKKQ